MFVPVGLTRTFAEITPAEKHAVSHRARAFARFAEARLTNKRRGAPEGATGTDNKRRGAPEGATGTQNKRRGAPEGATGT
jgi:hypothetical protein